MAFDQDRLIRAMTKVWQSMGGEQAEGKHDAREAPLGQRTDDISRPYGFDLVHVVDGVTVERIGVDLSIVRDER